MIAQDTIGAAQDLISHLSASSVRLCVQNDNDKPGQPPHAVLRRAGLGVLISPAVRSGHRVSYRARAPPQEPFRANGLVGQRPTYPRTRDGD